MLPSLLLTTVTHIFCYTSMSSTMLWELHHLILFTFVFLLVTAIMAVAILTGHAQTTSLLSARYIFLKNLLLYDITKFTLWLASRLICTNPVSITSISKSSLHRCLNCSFKLPDYNPNCDAQAFMFVVVVVASCAACVLLIFKQA